MRSFVDKKPHAVCLPLPFQSHIIAMLKLAKLLYLKGLRITFVNTEFNHQKMLKSRGPDSLNGFPDFQFETIPDGLPPCDINSTQEVVPLCYSMIKTFAGPFRTLITKLNKESASSNVSQVTCVVADAYYSTQLEPVVKGLGIPAIPLWTMSAAFLMSKLHCQHLVEQGLIPPKGILVFFSHLLLFSLSWRLTFFHCLLDKSDLLNGYLDTPVDSIPGMTDIRLKDLPSFFWEDDDPSVNFLLQQMHGVTKASAIIMNTFEDLEAEVLEALKPLLPPIYKIGPLQLLLQEISNKELNSVGSNIWKEDHESLKWLNSQQPNSVIYVNFGSLMVLTSEQFIEFAWGLADSGYPFLWVIRPDLIGGQTAIFPPGFIEETADRGRISGWCSQEQVLAHTSTAGFLTHSGWNSTMDTICAGVPVISWPCFSDQTMNCRYSCVHWGIGIELENNVKRRQIERRVRELMEGDKAKDMKRWSAAYKKSAEEATKPGGTSYEDLNRLVEMIAQKIDSS